MNKEEALALLLHECVAHPNRLCPACFNIEHEERFKKKPRTMTPHPPPPSMNKNNNEGVLQTLQREAQRAAELQQQAIETGEPVSDHDAFICYWPYEVIAFHECWERPNLLCPACENIKHEDRKRA